MVIVFSSDTRINSLKIRKYGDLRIYWYRYETQTKVVAFHLFPRNGYLSVGKDSRYLTATHSRSNTQAIRRLIPDIIPVSVSSYDLPPAPTRISYGGGSMLSIRCLWGVYLVRCTFTLSMYHIPGTTYWCIQCDASFSFFEPRPSRDRLLFWLRLPRLPAMIFYVFPGRMVALRKEGVVLMFLAWRARRSINADLFFPKIVSSVPR